MCGRFTRTADMEKIAAEFGIEQMEMPFEPSYNVAPTQTVAAIVSGDTKRLVGMRWGLIPSWAKDESIGNKMINARAETLTEKPSFRNLISRKRCAVVADGFYEWRKDASRKIPYYIRFKSQSPFAFAGLYDVWESPDAAPLTTCTIITTDANELMAPIHNRMPVIFSTEQVKLWLDATQKDKAFLLDLLKPYPSEELEAFTVSKLVNSPQNNSADCTLLSEHWE